METQILRRALCACAVFLFALAFAASPASAQLVYPALNYGYPPPQAVMALDYPEQGAPLEQSHIYFAGWAFRCDGHPISSPDLWVYVAGGVNGGGFKKWPSIATTGLYRPDVRAHYESVDSPCVVGDFSGWHLYPTKPLPEGAIAYAIQVYVPTGGYFLEGTGALMPSTANVNTRYLISFVRPVGEIPWR